MNEKTEKALEQTLADAIQAESATGKVLVIREGEAEKIKYPDPVRLSGTIFSPSEFWEKRKGLHDKNKCHVTYNFNKGEIILVVDERFGKENWIVTGKIVKNPDLVEFGINTNKTYTPKELMGFLKMNRVFFKDKDLNAKIVASLQNFKATVEKEIESMNDLRGNAKESRIQKLEMTMAESFELSMPIFKGQMNTTFKVLILANVREGAVEFYLESVELKEMQDEAAQKLIESEIRKFSELVCIEE